MLAIHSKENAPNISLVHHLILYGGLIDDYSLFYGQAGIAISLFEYSKRVADSKTGQWAEEILEDTLGALDNSLPYGLATGYAGIAWCICYLKWSSAIQVELPTFLEEIDRKIKEIDITRLCDLGLDAGLEGFLHYLLMRILLEPSFLLTDSLYLKAWDDCLALPRLEDSSLSELRVCYFEWRNTGKVSYDPKKHLKSWIEEPQYATTRLDDLPLGLKNGISGILFLQSAL